MTTRKKAGGMEWKTFENIAHNVSLMDMSISLCQVDFFDYKQWYSMGNQWVANERQPIYWLASPVQTPFMLRTACQHTRLSLNSLHWTGIKCIWIMSSSVVVVIVVYNHFRTFFSSPNMQCIDNSACLFCLMIDHNERSLKKYLSFSLSLAECVCET